MNIVASLNRIATAIIAAEPSYFSAGNTFVTPAFKPLTQLNRWYAEVWYQGSADFLGAGGGNLIRRYLVGVGVGTRLAVDLLGTDTQQTQEMILLMRRVTNTLHQFYDPLYFVEPLEFRSESEVKTFTLEAPDAQGAWCLQTYVAMSPIRAPDMLHTALPAIYP